MLWINMVCIFNIFLEVVICLINNFWIYPQYMNPHKIHILVSSLNTVLIWLNSKRQLLMNAQDPGTWPCAQFIKANVLSSYIPTRTIFRQGIMFLCFYSYVGYWCVMAYRHKCIYLWHMHEYVSYALSLHTVWHICSVFSFWMLVNASIPFTDWTGLDVGHRCQFHCQN